MRCAFWRALLLRSAEFISDLLVRRCLGRHAFHTGLSVSQLIALGQATRSPSSMTVAPLGWPPRPCAVSKPMQSERWLRSTADRDRYFMLAPHGLDRLIIVCNLPQHGS